MATPNLSLIQSTPLVTAGPAWASNVETNWSILDEHDHSPGKGASITPASININSALDFQSNFGMNFIATKYVNQGSVLGTQHINSVYAKDGNLYFNNGNGTAVQITNGTAINVAGVGGITGLAATTAAVTYNDSLKVFAFTQAPNQTATLDVGPITIRENVISAPGITINSPSGLSGAYSITLPTTLPVSTAVVKMTPLGVLTLGTVDTANVTDGAITYPKLAAPTVSQSNVVSFSTSSTTAVVVTDSQVTITTTGRPVLLTTIIDDPADFAYIVVTNNNSGATEATGQVYINRVSAGFVGRFGVGVDANPTPGLFLGSYSPPSGITTIDFPPPGTYTYELQLSVFSATSQITVHNFKLLAFEL